MSGRIRVLVADDDSATRDLLLSLFELADGFEVVGLACSAREVLRQALAVKPDVCVLDVRMPGGGLKAAERLGIWCPSVAVVVFSVFDDADTRRCAFAAGARAYVVKGSSVDEVVDAARNAARGRTAQRALVSIRPASSA